MVVFHLKVQKYSARKLSNQSSVHAENDSQYTYTLEYRPNYNSEAVLHNDVYFCSAYLSTYLGVET